MQTLDELKAIFSEAVKLQQSGRLVEAAEHYQAGLVAGANEVGWYQNLGFVLRDLGRLAEAEETFNAGLALYPHKGSLRRCPELC